MSIHEQEHAAWQMAPVAPPPRERAFIKAVGVVVGCVASGAVGFLGAVYTYPEPPAAPTPAIAAPTSGEITADTIDLCTSWAAAYAALPSPQTSVADLLPAASYVLNALRSDPAADHDIRVAVAESVKLWRAHAAALSHEPDNGAIQPGPRFSQQDADTSNAADEQAVTLCRSYQP